MFSINMFSTIWIVIASLQMLIMVLLNINAYYNE